MFVAADVRDEHDAERLVGEAFARFGRIDVLCNNAGVGLLKSITDTTREEYDRVLDTNLWGIFTCSRHAHPAHGRPRRRIDREYRLGRGDGRIRDRCCLLRLEGRRARPDAADGARLRQHTGFVSTASHPASSRRSR